MRVMIAPDKFKGSLTASEAARAIERGVLRADPEAVIDLAPMADGGEGIVEALVDATGGRQVEVEVQGPLAAPTLARFGLLGDGRSAVVAMSAASGLNLVPRESRDPTRTSTRGTGELILAALGRGVRRLIVGIGGSGTNDGGAGMAQALGYRLVDSGGREVGPGGGSLDALDRIDASAVDPLLAQADLEIEVACDVDNPLCGPNGASRIFGPQKGASPDQIERLDANLARLARIIRRDLGKDILDIPGGGAAGGLGAGLVAFGGASLRSGIGLVMDAVGLKRRLQGADLCLTGEGMLDTSTISGKTASGVAGLAASLGVPTIVLAGTIGPGAEAILNVGASAYFSICHGPTSLEGAMAQADAWLALSAEQATRAFLSGFRHRK